MILLNYSQDIKSGSDNILSLLFDMNEVFEKFIYRRLKREEENYSSVDLNVKSQLCKEFWNRKRIRPDIIIEYVDKTTLSKKKIILDTKWKVLQSASPSDSDLKQMYSYNLHFGANQSYLVYPKVYEIDSLNGSFHESLGVNEEYKKHECNLYFAELFDDNKSLKKTLGEEILKELIAESKLNSSLSA